MNNNFQISMKNRFLPKAFALFVIVTIMMPTSMLSLSPSYANAQEADSSSESTSSTPSETSSSEEKPAEVSGPADVASTNESSSTKTTDTIEPTSTETKTEATDVVTDNTTNTTDTTDNSGGGSSESRIAAGSTPATGSITVCKLIVDSNNNIITAPAANIPVGDFSIALRNENEAPIGVAEFSSSTFAPNMTVIGNRDDAQCVTFSNLPLIGYYYAPETVLGQSRESWQTPKYVDLLDPENAPVTLDRFHAYSGELFDGDESNDENRDQTADGHIVLNGVHPDRTLYVLNTFNPMTYGQIMICKLIVDANNNILTSAANLPASEFSVDLRNFSGSVIGSRIGLSTFNTATFAANAPTLSASVTPDAECVTYSNLPVGRYYYSQETITGNAAAQWATPRYHDLVTPPPIVDLTSFYSYSGELFDNDPNNNENREVNADGYIIVTDARPDRMLLVLNKFNGETTTPGNTAPVITVKGSNPATITVDTEFIDEGATALDAEDGDITSRLTATGEVNVAVVGTYTITYSVTDSGGLSDSKTRTVIVQANGGSDNNDNGGGGGRSGGRRRTAQTGAVLGATIDLSTTTCSYLNDYLKQGQQNNPVEVLKLQYFLKYFEGFSALEANGTFDDATFAAVSEFQNRYKSDILTPWNHNAPTGYVYILTKKKVNEIFCQTLFPLTGAQESEIAAFRAMLASQIENGGSSSMIETNDGVKDISDLVGSVFSTSTTVTLADDSSDDSDATSTFKAIASAIWSIPTDRGMLLQSLYFLLIAIIAIYLATEIIVGSMNTTSLTKYQVWARKSTAYIIGLAIAIIIAVSYKIFSIVIPLVLLLIVAGAFLAIAITKRSGDNVISLPPKN